MAQGGFKLVLNYRQLEGAEHHQVSYAKKAQALGMKIIWNIDDRAFWDGGDVRDKYSDLAATCACSDNKGFIRYVIHLVKALPSTWGYYIGDEVLPKDHAPLKNFSDLVKQLDPGHPRLFVSCSQCDHIEKAKPPYVSTLIPMVDTADVLATDWYPVGSGSDSVKDTEKVAAGVQSVADQHGKQSALVLQSFNWAQYPNTYHACQPYPSCMPYPSVDDMRQMRDLTLQNSHPRLILWYSYYKLFEADNPSLRWRNLIEAVGAAKTTPTPSIKK
jgi:hypothetical protein